MVRLVSGLKNESIDYSDIQTSLESVLLNSKRLDSRLFLDYRKPSVTIHQHTHASISTFGYLVSSASLTAESNVLSCRIYAHPSYSPPKSRVVTNVEFNKLDEEEIADIDGFNLNYSFWIAGIIDNIANRLVGDQLDQKLTDSEPIHHCYWTLNIFLNFDFYDGNGLDWSVFITNLALKNCKFPSVSLDLKAKFAFSSTLNLKNFFRISSEILSVTFCKVDRYVFLDPTLLEESFGRSFSLIIGNEYGLVNYSQINDIGPIEDKLEIAHTVVQLLLDYGRISG